MTLRHATMSSSFAYSTSTEAENTAMSRLPALGVRRPSRVEYHVTCILSPHKVRTRNRALRMISEAGSPMKIPARAYSDAARSTYPDEHRACEASCQTDGEVCENRN